MSTTAATRRVRPPDRKRHIEDAAAAAFAQRGYHAVGMGEVAAAVGISAPALYRHFPNKYALFAQAAFRTAHRLNEALEPIADDLPTDPAEAVGRLDELLAAVIDTSIELRAVGGLYRWEGRYLQPGDRRRLTAEFEALRTRLLRPLEVYRPELSTEQREPLVWAALSAIASITAHRTVLAATTLHGLLRAAAWRALDATPLDTAVPVPPNPPGPPPAARRREVLVREAIALFAARGYHEVTIEEIAAAGGLTASGVYRHFGGKSDILLVACERAADQLAKGLAAVKAAGSPPDQALRTLAGDYVRHSVENNRLMRVYFAEIGSLEPEAQRRLRLLQRGYVANWVDLLGRARPELTPREATVLVHAGFGIVVDLGVQARLRRVDATAQTVGLVQQVLGVG